MTVSSPPRNDRGQPLSAALREQTRIAHERAEATPFVRQLLSGALPLSAYAALAAQNYAIYRELEAAALRWRGHPAAGPFVIDQLSRVPHLEADLGQLLGDGWAAQAGRLRVPAAGEYVSRIREAAGWPGGFIAHHYVRYLGDLSGGQVILSGLTRIYGPDSRRYTRFYVFDGIGKLKPFRDQYRQLLDQAPLTPAERQRVIAEAVTAFELNTAMFTELAARHLPAETLPRGRTSDEVPRHPGA
jgi:heme oxygenase (biliverdin-producing, ferredoxin)